MMPDWAWYAVALGIVVIVALAIVYRDYATARGQFRKRRLH